MGELAGARGGGFPRGVEKREGALFFFRPAQGVADRDEAPVRAERVQDVPEPLVFAARRLAPRPEGVSVSEAVAGIELVPEAVGVAAARRRASLSSAVMSMTPSASAPSRRRSASEGTAANAAACRPRSTSTIRSWFRCLRGTGSKRLVAWNADARSNVQVNAVSSASASDSSGVSSSSLAVSVSASPSRPRASSAARRGLETSAAESFTETSSARALHATRMSSWMLRSQLTTSSNTTHFSNALGVISRYSLVSSTLLRSASTSPVWTISHAAMRHDASCFGYTIHEGWRHRPSATCR